MESQRYKNKSLCGSLCLLCGSLWNNKNLHRVAQRSHRVTRRKSKIENKNYIC